MTPPSTIFSSSSSTTWRNISKTKLVQNHTFHVWWITGQPSARSSNSSKHNGGKGQCVAFIVRIVVVISSLHCIPDPFFFSLLIAYISLDHRIFLWISPISCSLYCIRSFNKFGRICFSLSEFYTFKLNIHDGGVIYWPLLTLSSSKTGHW